MFLNEKIASGGTAEVYAYETDKIAKVFHDNIPDEAINHEFLVSRLISTIVVRSPKMYELIENTKERGYIAERIFGRSMLDYIMKKEGDIEELLHQFTSTHYQLHNILFSNTLGSSVNTILLSTHEWLKQRISWTNDLTEKEKIELYKDLYELPDGNSICHNDYHPGNLIITEDTYEICIIDWCDVSIGNPLADVARTILAFSPTELPPEIPPEVQSMLQEGRKLMKELYMKEYRKLSGMNLLELDKWIPVVAASRLFCEGESSKVYLLDLIRNRKR